MPFFRALAVDLPDIVTLVNSAYRGESARQGWTHESDYLDGQRTDLAALTADLAETPGAFLLTLRDEADGPLLGSVWLEPQGGETWYLGMLTVRPDLQARRLGRMLLAEAEAEALRRGARRMRMTVVHIRGSLIEWYVRRGYAPTGERKAFPTDQRFGVPRRDDLELLVLEKTLTDAPAHVLDRPVWNSLTTRQSHLALGGARAMRFDPAYGVFAATADASSESAGALVALASSGSELWVVETDAFAPPAGLSVVREAICRQMVAERLASFTPSMLPIEDLDEADAPQMLALARLTEPGPFFEHTHRFGRFVGVKEQGRLIAMAGERMQPTGFTEVSGVCTHPDHRGRGLAAALMRVVAARILARGETPFLHAYAANTGAIGLYASLGFVRRRDMTVTVLARP